MVVTYVAIISIANIIIIMYPHLCRLSLRTKPYKATKADAYFLCKRISQDQQQDPIVVILVKQMNIFYAKEYLKISSKILIVVILAF